LETIEFRDKLVAELGLELCAMYKTRLIKEKWLKKPENIPAETAYHNTLDAIEEFKFDACIGGARRDEEKQSQRTYFFGA
jgi:sulfate adenylyltransferase subunit 2